MSGKRIKQLRKMYAIYEKTIPNKVSWSTYKKSYDRLTKAEKVEFIKMSDKVVGNIEQMRQNDKRI